MASYITRPQSARLSLDRPANLLDWDNDELDALFQDSPSGAIPIGEMTGLALFFPGSRFTRALGWLTRALVWKGKRFDPERGELLNLLSPLRLPAVRAMVYEGDSWVDQRPCVVLDYSRTSWIARLVRDEIRLVAPDTYLGVAWLRKHRVAWFALYPKR
jgi:hypothetical protein